MLSRHAVLLTRNPTKDFYPESASGEGVKDSLLNPPIHLRLPSATPQESTLAEVFIPGSLNLFGINADWGRPHSAQFLCNVSPFRINTSESISKQTTLSTFRINTYEKQAGGGRGAFLPFSNPSVVTCRKTQVLSFHTRAHSFARAKTQLICFQSIPHSLAKNTRVGVSVFVERTTPEEASRRDLSRPYILTSLPPYFLTSRDGGALPAAMGAAAKRAYRLQERRSCRLLN
jgi:hypothetical protein